jgi:hypothetical protein
MSHRIDPPEGQGVSTSLAVVLNAPAPAGRHPLRTAAGLVSTTALSWRVPLPRVLGVVTSAGEVRRTWSRGPRQ